MICVSSSSDISGNGSEDVLAGSDDSFIYAIEGGEAAQEAVTAPDTPSGPSSGKVAQALTFTADGVSTNLGHSVEYRFDWGDTGFSAWGASSQDHTYWVVGNYTVKAQARCQIHPEVESAWSNGMTVAVSGHILTVIVDGSGTVTPSPDKAEYNHEETVALTANPSAENRFDRWEGAATGSDDTATIIMDGDKTVTAYFQEISELVSTPAPPVLPSGGEVLEQVSCTSSGSSSNLGHEVEYRFDWGNGNQSDWGDSSRSYMWDSAGTFSVKAQARCKVHTSIVSGWSPETGITIISTDVQDHITRGIPDRFELFQNFPNPFNMETCIIFQIPEACYVTCDILNVQGERICRLARGHRMAGEHRMTWDGKDASGNSCPSGIYFCRLDAGKERAIKWMMLLK